MKNPRLEQYKRLLAEEPGQLRKWYAEQVGVTPGTIGRWNKKLDKRSVEQCMIDTLRVTLQAEFDAKLKAALGEQEREREEAARKKQEAEARGSTKRRAYFKRILDTCAEVDIWPDSTVDVTWQGFRVRLIGGVKNTVPEVIAGVWRDSQKQKQQAEQTIRSYAEKQQYLGRV